MGFSTESRTIEHACHFFPPNKQPEVKHFVPLIKSVRNVKEEEVIKSIKNEIDHKLDYALVVSKDISKEEYKIARGIYKEVERQEPSEEMTWEDGKLIKSSDAAGQFWSGYAQGVYIKATEKSYFDGGGTLEMTTQGGYMDKTYPNDWCSKMDKLDDRDEEKRKLQEQLSNLEGKKGNDNKIKALHRYIERHEEKKVNIGNLINKNTKAPGKIGTIWIWDNLSLKFSNSVPKAEFTSYTTTEPTQNSTWKRVEEPVLQARGVYIKKSVI